MERQSPSCVKVWKHKVGITTDGAIKGANKMCSKGQQPQVDFLPLVSEGGGFGRMYMDVNFRSKRREHCLNKSH